MTILNRITHILYHDCSHTKEPTSGSSKIKCNRESAHELGLEYGEAVVNLSRKGHGL